MKQLMRYIGIILVFSLLLAVPTQAESVTEPRGSAFFAAYGTDLYKTSSTSFQIWFDVVANASTMQELGVSEIVLYRSADRQSWSQIKLYQKGVYPQMIEYNTGSHEGYVPYNFATSGYYYRARITFYAKNSTGIGENDRYTEIIKM